MNECGDSNCTYCGMNATFNDEEEVYINPETGEECCKYLDGAISEDEYKDWYSNYEEELWDDIN